jgi:fucose permease
MVVMLGLILPYIRSQNNFTYTQAGLMLSFHQVGYLLAVLVAGVLPFLIGRKRSTLLLCGGAVAGLVLAIFMQNWPLLVLAFALTGVGRGTLSNTCNVTVADVAGNRAAALNLLHSAFAFGAFVSPVIIFLWGAVSGVSAWKFGAVTVAVLLSVAWTLILRSNMPGVTQKKEDDRSFVFLKRASFWIPTMLLFLYLAVESSIVGWFVLYFIDAGLLPRWLTNFVPTMFWGMMMVGRSSVAAASGRIRNKNRALLIMATATALCFAVMLFSNSAILSVIFLLGVGLSLAGIYPTTMATRRGATSSVSTGFTIAISSFGSILMPGIIGAVADRRGLSNGIALVLVVLVLMVAVACVKIVFERIEAVRFKMH